MYRAALRRLALLVALACAITVVASLLLGLLIGADPDHAISVGFYLVGTFLLVAGFFVGNRGPTRVKSETPGPGLFFFPAFGSRRLRWATREEQYEAINQSAIFIGLGLVLVLLGIAIDSRHALF